MTSKYFRVVFCVVTLIAVFSISSFGKTGISVEYLVREFNSSLTLKNIPYYGLYLSNYKEGKTGNMFADFFNVGSIGIEHSFSEYKMDKISVLSSSTKLAAFDTVSSMALVIRGTHYFEENYIYKGGLSLGADLRFLYFDNAATKSGYSGMEVGVDLGYRLRLTDQYYCEPKIGYNYTYLNKAKLDGETGDLSSSMSGGNLAYSISLGGAF